jgi:hypothetical protein
MKARIRRAGYELFVDRCGIAMPALFLQGERISISGF